MSVEPHKFTWDRMIEAVQAVRERALRATAALEQAGIPYAMAGGNAVAAWVSTVDRAAVRNTQDVDILVRRSDYPAVKAALEGAGFVEANVMDVVCFIDGPDASPRDAVHLLFAGEKVRESYPIATADVTERVTGEDYSVVSLEALVRMKLNSFRDKDRTHLRDLIELGLLDVTWLPQLIPDHAARLQQLLDTPGG
ncbi:MAG: nucleotidyltransferase family protein [Planctomycetota bacterium]|nr:nucleotidyltransferase family protein [Planctomycetota bacterium]